jgi:hypothetical protein
MIELTLEQGEVLDGIMKWVEDDKTHVAILLGSAGTGKTTLLKTVVEKLIASKKTCSLLAPTGRAARILGKKSGRPAKTIHSEIYELGDIKADEHSDVIQGELDSPGFAIPFKLKNISDSKATIYIVDESSMVSDQTTQSEILSFGSGRLLHDLLHYVRVINCNRVKSKILFVGDDAQLPPVKCSESPALSKKYFLSEFKLNSSFFKLEKVLRQAEGSLILDNAERIRNSIFNKKFSAFNISEDGQSVRKVRPTQAVKDTPTERNTGNSVIITVSNKDALTYNLAIRRERFGTSNIPIQKGDVLLVCRNSAKNKYFNGDLLTAIDIDQNVECRTINVSGGDGAVDIFYRNILVRSVDEEGSEYNQQCKVIENLLYKPSSTLSLIENRAMMADFRKQHSNIDINSEEFRTKLLGDEYFNALLVKFGYAITCHKAQGGEWDNVYVSFSGFPNRDSDFYRWAYTAITRSKKSLGVIDAPTFGQSDIHHFNSEVYGDNESNFENETDSYVNEGVQQNTADEIKAETKNDNRGEKWSSEEDGKLLSEFDAKISMTEISLAHGRTKGAIISRLKRLGLIENSPFAKIESTELAAQQKLPSESTQKIHDDVKPRSGSWKKSELEKVVALWGISSKGAHSIKSISLETGRSNLAIIIQLYKAKLITLDDGDALSGKCECANILSKAILLYQPDHEASIEEVQGGSYTSPS